MEKYGNIKIFYETDISIFLIILHKKNNSLMNEKNNESNELYKIINQLKDENRQLKTKVFLIIKILD